VGGGSAVSLEDRSSPELEPVRLAGAALIGRLTEALNAATPDLASALAVGVLDHSGRRTVQSAGGGYREASRELHALIPGPDNSLPYIRDTLGRLLLAGRLAVLEPRTVPLRLPASILTLHPELLMAVHAALASNETLFDPHADRWKKYYALLTGRLIPVGAEFTDVQSGITRRSLFSGGIGQCLWLLHTVLLRTRGTHPLLELHAHPGQQGAFHTEGWQATCQRLAELLLLNPQYKGVMAPSWFGDSSLRAISPRLRYLRDYPEQHGAVMADMGTDPEGSSGALLGSPARCHLHAEGRYHPRIHLMIWPRSQLIRWHEYHKARPDA